VNLEIIPKAQSEISGAARYYREQSPGLDGEFLADVDAGVQRIVADPGMFEQVKPGLRRCLLDRFPYGIYYRMPDENTVRIIIVRHHSRRPGFGMRRK